MVPMRHSNSSSCSTCNLCWVEDKTIRFYVSLAERQGVKLFQKAINILITLTCLVIVATVVSCVRVRIAIALIVIAVALVIIGWGPSIYIVTTTVVIGTAISRRIRLTTSTR